MIIEVPTVADLTNMQHDHTSAATGGIIPGAGSVSSVAAGDGMDFTTITTTGNVDMGTPSNITSTSTNSASGTTHSHAIDSTVQITNVTSKAIGYTALTSDYLILADAGSGLVDIVLPAASNKGKILVVKRINSGANNVTVTRADGDTIEGLTSVTLGSQYATKTFIADGTSTWYVISSNTMD